MSLSRDARNANIILHETNQVPNLHYLIYFVIIVSTLYECIDGYVEASKL